MEWSESVRVEGSKEHQRFLESHVDLVRYVAFRIVARLPASVELDDLVHDGILGLLDAVGKFDPDRGVRFRTYAERRVRGAILDGLRLGDWQPRTVRRGRRDLDDAMSRLSAKHGRPAEEEEVAEALGLEISKLRKVVRDSSLGSLLPLDQLADGAEPEVTGDIGQPHAALETKELLESLVEGLARLPARERQVLELYYHEELNMKEIGVVLGVTESRVCQLHGQAASRLRAELRARLSAPACAGASSPATGRSGR
ncbi:MAG: FliA/WhiG family RNA polymerase sigma factor [bacterium]|nr:FliA/WhiG family RNA polymerase sigma factor [bacterium]